MNLYFLALILLCFIGINFYFKNFNLNYINKDCTTCINGIFILIVFYSHLATYIDVQYTKDFLMLNFRNYLGQLMVTPFLFYSGYGIYYQIKNKKIDYINSLPIQRILKTWIKFAIAILTFVIINIILNKPLTISNIFLSFIGWASIGNSNWYIFSIIIMYILTFISFKIFDNNKNSLILNTILIILYILFLSLYKEDYWYNTLLCYLFGMLYCYKKEAIEKVLFNNFNYVVTLVIVIISFVLFRNYAFINYWYFEIYSILFIMLLLLMTLKINISNKILKWIGKKLFWIYILQRIPMILFKELGFYNHAYKYSIVVFISTILLTLIYSSIFDKALNKFTSNLNLKLNFRKNGK